jgi:catechol 2,3-dioxygenase-like lactoylglutathione lyase family enzyme
VEEIRMIGYVVLGTNNLPRATAFYDALLAELGGTDEGPPGLRGEGGEGFYAAYFRDLDGNKLDVFSYG